MSNNYCINCDRKVPIWIRHRDVMIEHDSVTTKYDELYAICQYCGEEIYDPKVNDMNVERRRLAISEAQKSTIERTN